jgi:hypothetical protein
MLYEEKDILEYYRVLCNLVTDKKVFYPQVIYMEYPTDPPMTITIPGLHVFPGGAESIIRALRVRFSDITNRVMTYGLPKCIWMYQSCRPYDGEEYPELKGPGFVEVCVSRDDMTWTLVTGDVVDGKDGSYSVVDLPIERGHQTDTDSPSLKNIITRMAPFKDIGSQLEQHGQQIANDPMTVFDSPKKMVNDAMGIMGKPLIEMLVQCSRERANQSKKDH